MQISFLKRISLNAVQILAIGFAIVIFIGAVMLTLPISSSNGTVTNFLDSLFTSTSAVCVTGLITVDTGTHWSYFGKTVIMLLIEIGGLGFMSFATLIALLMGKKITLKERLLLQEALNASNIQGLVKLAKYLLIFTLSVQFSGALLLSTQFIPEFGVGKGIYYSVFHAVSAFCNAGFDLIGNFSSLTGYANNSVIILTIAGLIAIGGLGFAVWAELYNYKKSKRLSLHTKVVVSMTLFLIIAGSILMFIFEFNNPGTMKGMSFKGKVLSSIFASISPRTAGLNSIPTDAMSTAGKFLTIILMFIGGSPGSTAGGIKTTTAGILLMTVISVIRGRNDTEVFHKRISKEIVYRAFAVTTLGLALVTVVTMILSITEVGASFEYLLYEVTSAFATVGLTLGLTTKLTSIGKVLIALTMYLGRVGPMTVVLALTNKKGNNAIRYPEEKIMVG
ncbi:TrkH family potassium uptake protein [Clostridium algidicarnis]|uniref:TrkH family potassium uptake protein n=1 Tax=Clostridium algidicarnis TaxID=37659 RepID=UPI001C0BEDCD|nr:TrkH family potassium uptake protein [Clostridium algidicarnis]MBU3195349.1 TrkH family potassium uptake protein [Clostridium algidicarnis]MBU3208308.1 TrkH family potassium uptake protein [Clostridium algidicarnis]MBU3227460.1 TrkH family potassium uptake protein [Clostridium algidicarnis]MBU3251133.1 TrkH family potassium uptake protein [Clostridium algidicarnis]